ncbi:hypothetical protein MJA45_05530 [Paenibacillus aurantius]|uniref:Uncharacterized protein n=1 Tax=Paenibacillus aurantius TaxID=2918900 RepID=A0AA96LFT1_9BACL|nr:hypothetical protein [Paenibacillus aurantius]WNQ12495.1 hypothetical protein MJA45_05530 [Paenibacillus aurantius]
MNENGPLPQEGRFFVVGSTDGPAGKELFVPRMTIRLEEALTSADGLFLFGLDLVTFFTEDSVLLLYTEGRSRTRKR